MRAFDWRGSFMTCLNCLEDAVWDCCDGWYCDNDDCDNIEYWNPADDDGYCVEGA